VIVDIGTGDGRFVYQSARQNPSRFYIGIDASTTALEKVSEKVHRKPSKGGMPNLLFLKAAVEDLPDDLTSIADEVHIHFPWGSLLEAIASGDGAVIAGIRRICRTDALLEVIIGIDAGRDRTEIARLGIETITEEFIQQELTVRYADAGFHVTENGKTAPEDCPKLCTSWALKLQSGCERQVFYLIAQAT
jgi:16S rRNA (adenine(1408)-N(1))-methyltransferase